MSIGEAEVDHAGIKDWAELTNRVAEKWRAGTLDVLQSRNTGLLEQLNNLECQIDSLLLITQKPKAIKKQWRETLDEYERTVNQAIAYASRHLDAAKSA